MTSKHDYIQEAAYFIWLNRGRPEGQDLEIWNEATKLYELTQKIITPSFKKAPAKKVAKKAAPKKVKAVAPVVKKEEKKPVAKKVASSKKSVAKKTSAKPVVKKVAVKKAPAKKVAKKTTTKKVEVAKIIPMVKKEVATKKHLIVKIFRLSYFYTNKNRRFYRRKSTKHVIFSTQMLTYCLKSLSASARYDPVPLPAAAPPWQARYRHAADYNTH